MENEKQAKQIESAKQLIDATSNVAGAAAGGALGFILGDASGAALGGYIGGILTAGVKKVLLDVSSRELSLREQSRVGTAAYFAIERISKRLESGERLRSDEFFKEREVNSRSDADEIFEGALLKSKNEHEEKKIKFIANIFSTTAFHSEISSSEANHILQVAESMTYRQMCLLSLFERKAEIEGIKLAERDIDKKLEDDISIIKEISALQEVFQLYNLGLVALLIPDSIGSDGFADAQITNEKNYLLLDGYDSVVPSYMILTKLGRRYFELMNLSEIPEEDLKVVAKTLSA